MKVDYFIVIRPLEKSKENYIYLTTFVYILKTLQENVSSQI